MPCAQESATLHSEGTQRHAARVTTIGEPASALARSATNTCRLMSAPFSRVAETTVMRLMREPLGQTSAFGLVSRVTPVHTALRNCTRDEGRSFEVGNQVLISSHRKLLSSKAMVVNVAEKSGHDPVRQG